MRRDTVLEQSEGMRKEIMRSSALYSVSFTKGIHRKDCNGLTDSGKAGLMYPDLSKFVDGFYGLKSRPSSSMTCSPAIFGIGMPMLIFATLPAKGSFVPLKVNRARSIDTSPSGRT